MKELLEFVARALVDRPDAVVVRESSRGDGIVLELRVDPDDLGKVIGKRGRTAKSIRTLLGVAEAKGGRRVALEIAE
jgi:hypothetical protein